MTIYELMFIISPEADKETEVKMVQGQVQNLGGEIRGEDDWGRRTLSYPIKHQTAGNYYLMGLQLSGEKATELRRELRLREGLLRFMIIKTEGGGN